jgi:uncharacterized membrane protein YdfJ with MMPL/SSD domain
VFTLLGRFLHKRRRTVLAVTLACAVLAGIWGSGVFSAMGEAEYTDPSVESERANALLEAEFSHTEPDMVAVYVDPAQRHTVEDAAFAEAVAEALDGLPEDRVASVTSFWSRALPESERERLVAHDRHATAVALTMEGKDLGERLENYAAILDDLEAEGLEVSLGGELTSHHELTEVAMSDLVTAQAITLPILFVLLVVIFRGVVAAAVPVVLGLLSILGSMALLRLLSLTTDISIFALQITMLLGLGLAIDYGLFLVSRFRDELARRGDTRTALPATLATAGRTVAFSGLTVIAALSGMLLFPEPISSSIGWGGISVVLFTVAAALVVLPALLALLGPRINAWALPWPRRGAADGSATREEGRWSRLALAVMRRPLLSATAVTTALLIAAIPLLSLNPGLVNHRYLPEDSDGQTSARILQEQFPADGPAQASVDIAVTGGVDDAALQDYARGLERFDAADAATVVQANTEVAQVTVTHTGDPDAPDNLRLVEEIRAEPWPEGAEQVLVGGTGGAALSADGTASTLSSLPGVLAFVVAAMLVLLCFAFRSVLLPVKAVALAFLSLAATFGLLTWGLQEGNLAPLLGFVPVGTVDLWAYGIILVIALGLITDYELFIVSRAREAYRETGDNTRGRHRAPAHRGHHHQRGDTDGRGGRHHGHRLAVLGDHHARHRAGHRDPARRHRGPRTAGPGDDAPVRRRQLVDPSQTARTTRPHQRRSARRRTGLRSVRRCAVSVGRGSLGPMVPGTRPLC